MDLVDTLDSILSSDTPEPHRILIIDDEKMAEYHSLILQNANLSVHIINDAKTVVDVIFNYKPDLILMDMVMPQCKGSVS